MTQACAQSHRLNPALNCSSSHILLLGELPPNSRKNCSVSGVQMVASSDLGSGSETPVHINASPWPDLSLQCWLRLGSSCLVVLKPTRIPWASFMYSSNRHTAVHSCILPGATHFRQPCLLCRPHCLIPCFKLAFPGSLPPDWPQTCSPLPFCPEGAHGGSRPSAPSTVLGSRPSIRSLTYKRGSAVSDPLASWGLRGSHEEGRQGGLKEATGSLRRGRGFLSGHPTASEVS